MKIARVHAVLLFALLAATAAVAATRARHRAPAPAAGPVLVVRAAISDASAGGGASREDGAAEDRAMALAGASIAPEDRKRILEQLDYTRARLEARMSPLGTDFEDGDPVEELRRSMRPHMPAFTAARELERGTWQSAELAVRVATSCADAKVAADETCISLWDPSDGPRDIGRRARFLAWAASHAVVVDLGTRARAEECARALRIRTSLEASTLALVLMDEDLDVHPTPERAELEASAHRLGRAMAASGTRDGDDIAALARPTPVTRAVPWLRLPSTAVVPRLSAIADAAGLKKEIEGAAGANVRWLHAP